MSRILEEVHETAKDLHEVGAFSNEQRAKFDILCLPPVPAYSPSAIKELRSSCNLNQKEMARILNVSTSTLQKWETGAKKPAGAARKLLDVVCKKGITALL